MFILSEQSSLQIALSAIKPSSSQQKSHFFILLYGIYGRSTTSGSTSPSKTQNLPVGLKIMLCLKSHQNDTIYQRQKLEKQKQFLTSCKLTKSQLEIILLHHNASTTSLFYKFVKSKPFQLTTFCKKINNSALLGETVKP